MFGWRMRQTGLPVQFGIYSLEQLLAEPKNYVADFSVYVDEIIKKLEGAKGMPDYQHLEERIRGIEHMVGDLRTKLDYESPLHKQLTSLAPGRNVLRLRPGKQRWEGRIIRESLGNSRYFVQILRAHNQRSILWHDISDYTYLAEPFTEEDQLARIVQSAHIPAEYSDNFMTAFRKVKKSRKTQMGEFSIHVEERYHPVISRLSSGIKYVTGPAGMVAGGVGGAALGAGVGAALVGVAAVVVGIAAAVVGAGVVTGSAAAIAGTYYGAKRGAQIGYSLQERIARPKREG